MVILDFHFNILIFLIILYFLSFLKGVHRGERCSPPDQFASLRDTTCPLVCTSLKNQPASRIKILFDGIIAALQNNLVPPPLDTVKILSQKHCVDAQLIYTQMCKPIFPAISSLRSIPLIRLFSAGVQWHPVDDLCEDCILTVNQSNQLYCDAYLYSLPT